MNQSIDNGDCGGSGSMFTYDCLNLEGAIAIARVGHAVRDDGGLKSHDWELCIESLENEWRYSQKLIDDGHQRYKFKL